MNLNKLILLQLRAAEDLGLARDMLLAGLKLEGLHDLTLEDLRAALLTMEQDKLITTMADAFDRNAVRVFIAMKGQALLNQHNL